MKPHILILSLGGTITMVPGAGGGIAPKLGAAELVASVPALADVAEIEAESPLRVASPSLTITNVVEVAKRIESAFADGAEGGSSSRAPIRSRSPLFSSTCWWPATGRSC